ncbi:Pre-rRNA-processing protein RIX1 [Nakaseomyces bracarensis]|uniref:Pre-rRNA-processing protein RIX1 n=1 Tax=Nakaseomyces bracarensis TaxID=273131 RepID=A0ABR4NTH4_9SACH
MSTDSILPVTVLAKQLPDATGHEFQNILKLLRSQKYVDEKLLKTDLALLVTKIQKLLNSHASYDIWKGAHAATVICAYNPLVLMIHGGKLLDIVYQKFETKVSQRSTNSLDAQGHVVLKSLLDCLSIIMDLMRNKPSLSRESLVPKLKAVIPTLINLSQYEPASTLPIIRTLMFKHTTTFKPFVNKLRSVLVHQLTKNFDSFNKDTQRLICDSYAYLHLAKAQTTKQVDEHSAHHKTFQDENWVKGLISILAEFKPLVELCGEILDFSQEVEINNLLSRLPEFSDIEGHNSIFPTLSLDMNEATTLFAIPQRLAVLSSLLTSFISLPTSYTIRIPMDRLNILCEVLLSMTPKLVPMKRELRRDNELTVTIQIMLSRVQFIGVQLYDSMTKQFGRLCLTYSRDILYSLSLFIPFKPKTTNIDYKRCVELKHDFIVIYQIIQELMKGMGHQYHDVNILLQLVDIGLYLTEDNSLIENVFQSQRENNSQQAGGVKTKSKKDTKKGTLSDLFVNSSQFTLSCDESTYNVINVFLTNLVANQKLPTSQMTKITKYAITSSVYYKQSTGTIPTTFTDLLRTLVIQPGNERISILPMAVTLLKDTADNVFDMLCHPRLPMSIIHHAEMKNEVTDEIEEEIEDISNEESHNTEHGKQSESEVIASITNVPVLVENESAPTVQYDNDVSAVVDQKREYDNDGEEEVHIKKIKIQEGDNTVSIKVTETKIEAPQSEPVHVHINDNKNTEDDDDEDSEFEIPAIELSDDDDE